MHSIVTEKKGLGAAHRPLKFALIGILNTAIDLSILNVLMFVFGFTAGIYFALFKTISFAAAATNSYFWNRFWTFERPVGFETKEYVIFFIMSAIGLALNVGTASIVVDGIKPQLGFSPELWANGAALFAVFVSMTWNFLSYTLIVFARKNPDITQETKNHPSK